MEACQVFQNAWTVVTATDPIKPYGTGGAFLVNLKINHNICNQDFRALGDETPHCCRHVTLAILFCGYAVFRNHQLRILSLRRTEVAGFIRGGVPRL